MKFLRWRSVAITIMILSILISVPLGARCSLLRLSNSAKESFYKSENGIDANLNKRITLSGKIITKAREVLGDDAVSLAENCRKNLICSETPSEKYRANAALTESIGSLIKKINFSSEKNSIFECDYVKPLYENFVKAQESIDESSYNERARSFNLKLQKMPAKFLSKVSFIEPLELFL